MSTNRPAGRSSGRTEVFENVHTRQHQTVVPSTIGRYGRSLLDLAGSLAGPDLVEVDVRLPFLDLRVRAPEGPMLDAVGSALLPSTLDLPSRAIEITVLHGGRHGVPAPLPWGQGAYVPHHISAELRAAGLQGSLFHGLSFWQFFDFATSRGVQLMAASDAFPPWEPGAPLRAFLHWAYADQGLRLTHAGTLGRDGRGVLLAGAGGSGKSGTVLAGLLGGLASVGDDYVLVEAGRDGVRAFPVFSTLKQDPAGFERLGLASRIGPRPLNWQGKYQFRIDELVTGGATDRLDVAAILLPRIGAGPTRITPAGPKEALLALAPSALYQMPGERESGFRFFSGVVAALPAYHLELGPDPAEVAGAIEAFIDAGAP